MNSWDDKEIEKERLRILSILNKMPTISGMPILKENMSGWIVLEFESLWRASRSTAIKEVLSIIDETLAQQPRNSHDRIALCKVIRRRVADLQP